MVLLRLLSGYGRISRIVGKCTACMEFEKVLDLNIYFVADMVHLSLLSAWMY